MDTGYYTQNIRHYLLLQDTMSTGACNPIPELDENQACPWASLTSEKWAVPISFCGIFHSECYAAHHLFGALIFPVYSVLLVLCFSVYLLL